MTNPVRSLLPVLVALGLVAAGCGGDGDRSSATTLDTDAVLRAAERDGMAETTVEIEAEGFGLGEPLRVTGEGTTSLTASELDLTLDGGPVFERMGVPVDGPVRLVMVGERVSLDVPEELRAQIPGGRRWIGLDLAAATGASAEATRALMRIDLAGSLAPFQAGAPLNADGEEEVDGVPTTRWKGEISADDYLDTLPQAEHDEIRAALMEGPSPMTEAELAARHPVTLWIDEDSRVRRSVSTTKLAASQGMAAGTVTFRFDLHGHGEPGPIEAPAVGDVWDATDAVTSAAEQAG